MNTNRAAAYSPERIALREQEGMTICDNCLMEVADSDLDVHQSVSLFWERACLGRVEYLANYTAAPESGWCEMTFEGLDDVSRDLGDSFSADIDTEWGRKAWHLDRDTLNEAIDLAQAGKQILMASDEDGYYFAVVKA